MLGIYTGFRISELLSLQVKDVCQYGRILDRVQVPRRSMKGQHASRSVPLHHHAHLVLKEWIQNMPPFFEVAPQSYVFRSRTGGGNKPLSRVQAHRILKLVFDNCQMPGPLGTHSMRKTFARRVHLILGGDLAKTRKALGQKNIQSTIHYMGFMDSEIDEAILQQ